MLNESSLCFVIFSLVCVIPFGISLRHDSPSDLSSCCMADEWEGLMYLEYGTALIVPHYDHLIVLGINASVHVAYSFTRQKVYFNITSILGTPLNPDTPAPFDAIYLYDFTTETSYMYTVQDGTCKKDQILHKLARQCVPGNAMLLSSGGFGEKGHQVVTYQFNVTYDSTWLVTATVLKDGLTPSCEPVHVTYSSPSYPDSGILYSMDIMDVGPIKSGDVFDIPKPCRNLP